MSLPKIFFNECLRFLLSNILATFAIGCLLNRLDNLASYRGFLIDNHKDKVPDST